ncbi:MAG TPA: zf-HC2 domain-containing protein [Steroidobacteraceae bacterium]
MTDSHFLENGPEHREICELLPWYVNGTLDELARHRVDAHLVLCPVCRDELTVERRVFAKIDGETAIDYMPGPSLKRLNARLNTLQNNAGLPLAQPRNPTPWHVLAAASVAAVTVTIGVLLIDRWVQFRAPVQPAYRTVTNSAPRPRDEVIRAVFAPSVTLVELQALLDEAQLRIVSGPSEAGVYSLASNSDKPVRASLEQLRRHSTVRFAEATRLERGSGDSP